MLYYSAVCSYIVHDIGDLISGSTSRYSSIQQRQSNQMSQTPTKVELMTNSLDLLVKRNAIPQGVAFQVKREQAREFMAEALISAVVTIPIGIATNLFSSWLYDQYCSSKKRDTITITINGAKLTKISIEAIQRAIESHEEPK